ncbi:hypothetical protein DRW48_10550 [Paracoccus suum]|uniref:Uncharacterized protein n=1 Tax=Paracoccus suum TaxID=2259340 RepID=A0A344PL19_9RHOB|nr:hypothetical protein [Paracoccus suum]AXC50074.1 hypothetical protein DRW48_10550 [Paracoccus suum]
MATTGIPLKGVTVPPGVTLPITDWVQEIAKIPDLLGLWVADEDYLIRNSSGGVTSILPEAGNTAVTAMGTSLATTSQSTALGDQVFSFPAAYAAYGRVPLKSASKFTILQVWRVEATDTVDDHLFTVTGSTTGGESFVRLTANGGHFWTVPGGISAGLGTSKLDMAKWHCTLHRADGTGLSTFDNGVKAKDIAPTTTPTAETGLVSLWARDDAPAAGGAIIRGFVGYSPLFAVWDRAITDAEAAAAWTAVQRMHPNSAVGVW